MFPSNLCYFWFELKRHPRLGHREAIPPRGTHPTIAGDRPLASVKLCGGISHCGNHIQKPWIFLWLLIFFIVFLLICSPSLATPLAVDLSEIISQVMGYSDTDVAEFIFTSKPSLDSLVKFLCHDISKSCLKKPPPVPKVDGPFCSWIPASELAANALLMGDADLSSSCRAGLPGNPSFQSPLKNWKWRRSWGPWRWALCFFLIFYLYFSVLFLFFVKPESSLLGGYPPTLLTTQCLLALTGHAGGSEHEDVLEGGSDEQQLRGRGRRCRRGRWGWRWLPFQIGTLLAQSGSRRVSKKGRTVVEKSVSLSATCQRRGKCCGTRILPRRAWNRGSWEGSSRPVSLLGAMRTGRPAWCGGGGRAGAAQDLPWRARVSFEEEGGGGGGEGGSTAAVLPSIDSEGPWWVWWSHQILAFILLEIESPMRSCWGRCGLSSKNCIWNRPKSTRGWWQSVDGQAVLVNFLAYFQFGFYVLRCCGELIAQKIRKSVKKKKKKEGGSEDQETIFFITWSI